MTRRGGTLLVACCAFASIAWLDTERSRIGEANRLLNAGKAQEAVQRYGEALIDDPDSPLLNYNMGNAHYKAGQFGEALASYGRVRTAENDPKGSARIAYNAGNAQYRLAATMENDKPQEALKAYAQALVAYRRALGSDPTDQDAKFNYEFVAKKIDDLKKKLEEQQKQQEQNKDQQQQDQQDQDQQQQQDADKQQEPNQSQEPKEDQKQPKPADEPKKEEAAQNEQQKAQPQEQAEQPQPRQAEPAEQSGAQAAEGKKPEDQARQEAEALLDSAKGEEVSPEEFARRAQGGAVAEPAQDW